MHKRALSLLKQASTNKVIGYTISRYVVYGANCSSSYPYKMLGAAKGGSFKATGLKKGTYYVRVRNVKGSGTGRLVSKWSKVKKLKVK